jgi:delta-aminolevulinic acid dehydratase/porphobilinogen synthase
MTFSFFTQEKCEKSHLWTKANEVHIVVSDAVHRFRGKFSLGQIICENCAPDHAKSGFCGVLATRKPAFLRGF